MIAIKRPFWGGLFLLLISIIFYLRTEDAVVLRIVVLVGGLIVGAYLWATVSLRGLKLNRFIRINRHQVGQFFEERFELINQLPILRVWVEVKDEGTLPLNAGSRVISWIGSRQIRSYVSRTMLFRRGSYKLGPTRLISGDPFGLFEYSKVVPGEKIIIVLPHFSKLDRFVLPAGFLPGGKAQKRRSLEVTPYAAGIRDYLPGDPLSRIHWKSTAKRGQMMVKEFEKDQHANVWVFLDAEKNINYRSPEIIKPIAIEHFWTGKASKEIHLPIDTFEYSISAAASICEYYLRQGKAVGLAAAGRVITVISPDRGERQISKILENLTFLESDGGLPILGLIQGQAPNIARGSIVVIVSPAWDNRLAIAVEDLTKRDFQPVIVSINPKSFGLPVSTAQTIDQLRLRSIPVFNVENGSNLKQILEVN